MITFQVFSHFCFLLNSNSSCVIYSDQQRYHCCNFYLYELFWQIKFVMRGKIHNFHSRKLQLKLHCYLKIVDSSEYECLRHISTCGANAFSFLLWLSTENEVIEETKQSFHKDFSHSFPDQKKNHSHTRQRRSTGNQHKLTLCVDYLIISIKSYKILKYVLQFPLHNPVLMIYLSVHPQW